MKELGGKSSVKRTAEQTLIARFWADFSYTTSPAGHWNDIARSVSLAHKLRLAESARLFAILNVALADTCIAVWATKYHYNFWRPVTAITRADEDGNAATLTGKGWEPLLASPPHPEYVSGHSAISGAGAMILGKWFGAEGLYFEVESDDVKDVKRAFTSFRKCAEEIARSRVYGGIHFSSAGREGLEMGGKVAEAVWRSFDR
ncbi:MAG: vanadium-dependent haloperoxidase [Roseimicrobium sp.]